MDSKTVSKARKQFHGKLPPTGANWAKLFKASAKTILKGERFCAGNWQLADYSGVCASGHLALALNPVDILKNVLGLHVVEKYKENDVSFFVFDISDSDEAKQAIAAYIERTFNAKQVTQMLSSSINGDNERSDSYNVANMLEDFVIAQNDGYADAETKDAIGSVDESALLFLDERREKMETGRAAYVKAQLLAAAKFAEKYT